MARGCTPDGAQLTSNAERQARYRARHLSVAGSVAHASRQHADHRSRPQRWYDAVAELVALQAEYADWFAVQPDSLQDTATATATANALRSSASTSIRSSASTHSEATAATDPPPRQRPRGTVLDVAEGAIPDVVWQGRNA